jgi:hypothetical protein
MMPAEVPRLTPLMLSNPGDRFDPADPWFDSLDPSRKGYSFSRSYGFAMSAMSDPLPAGTRMHLRKLSSSPELEFHRYSGSPPKAWAPIFGTASTPESIEWSGLMFHPAVSAPPGTNELFAIFDAYLASTETGEEIPNSSTGMITLVFANMPDDRPLLSIERGIIVSWPAPSTNWVLEMADILSPSSWTAAATTPVLADSRLTVTLDDSSSSKFLRLRLNQ